MLPHPQKNWLSQISPADAHVVDPGVVEDMVEGKTGKGLFF